MELSVYVIQLSLLIFLLKLFGTDRIRSCRCHYVLFIIITNIFT